MGKEPNKLLIPKPSVAVNPEDTWGDPEDFRPEENEQDLEDLFRSYVLGDG